MPIVNRDLDVSLQKEVYTFSSTAQVSTGATQWIGMMPYAGTIQSVRSLAAGLSGAMQLAFQITRFTAGGTVISCGISNMVLAEFGTSGVMGYSGLAAPGSTLLNFVAGDVLTFQTSVANTAARNLIVEMVVKKTQDIVSHNGVST